MEIIRLKDGKTVYQVDTDYYTLISDKAKGEWFFPTISKIPFILYEVSLNNLDNNYVADSYTVKRRILAGSKSGKGMTGSERKLVVWLGLEHSWHGKMTV